MRIEKILYDRNGSVRKKTVLTSLDEHYYLEQKYVRSSNGTSDVEWLDSGLTTARIAPDRRYNGVVHYSKIGVGEYFNDLMLISRYVIAEDSQIQPLCEVSEKPIVIEKVVYRKNLNGEYEPVKKLVFTKVSDTGYMRQKYNAYYKKGKVEWLDSVDTTTMEGTMTHNGIYTNVESGVDDLFKMCVQYGGFHVVR